MLRKSLLTYDDFILKCFENIQVKYMNGSEKTLKRSMNIWKSGSISGTVIASKAEIKELILESVTPDTYYDNNRKTY